MSGLSTMKPEHIVLSITPSPVSMKHYDLRAYTPEKDKQGFFRWKLLHIIFTSDKYVLLADIRKAIIKHTKFKHYKELKPNKILSNKQINDLGLIRIIQDNHLIT